jgi:hypothetical protein
LTGAPRRGGLCRNCLPCMTQKCRNSHRNERQPVPNQVRVLPAPLRKPPVSGLFEALGDDPDGPRRSAFLPTYVS